MCETLSMTASAVSRREKGPNNTRYECFIPETFSMNISCTEMSGREQQSGARASYCSITFNAAAANMDPKQISVQGFKLTEKTYFALILILLIHTGVTNCSFNPGTTAD